MCTLIIYYANTLFFALRNFKNENIIPYLLHNSIFQNVLLSFIQYTIVCLINCKSEPALGWGRRGKCPGSRAFRSLPLSGASRFWSHKNKISYIIVGITEKNEYFSKCNQCFEKVISCFIKEYFRQRPLKCRVLLLVTGIICHYIYGKYAKEQSQNMRQYSPTFIKYAPICPYKKTF